MVEGGGPAGVKDRTDGGGPAGVVDGLAPNMEKELSILSVRLRRVPGVDGGLEERGTV